MLNSFYPFGKDPILNGMSSHQSKKMQWKMEWLRAEQKLWCSPGAVWQRDLCPALGAQEGSCSSARAWEFGMYETPVLTTAAVSWAAFGDTWYRAFSPFSPGTGLFHAFFTPAFGICSHALCTTFLLVVVVLFFCLFVFNCWAPGWYGIRLALATLSLGNWGNLSAPTWIALCDSWVQVGQSCLSGKGVFVVWSKKGLHHEYSMLRYDMVISVTG